MDAQAVEELAALVTRSVTDFAPIADPADLAKMLARQARDAKESLPGDLRAVAPLLDDYRQALGLSFDIDDAKGDGFFHSNLIQAAFYSLPDKVYPRPCGETRTCSATRLRKVGLSPPVRGNLSLRRTGRRRSRSIPARAGKP